MQYLIQEKIDSIMVQEGSRMTDQEREDTRNFALLEIELGDLFPMFIQTAKMKGIQKLDESDILNLFEYIQVKDVEKEALKYLSDDEYFQVGKTKSILPYRLYLYFICIAIFNKKGEKNYEN